MYQQENTRNRLKNVKSDYKASVTASLIIHYGIKHNKLFEVAPKEVLDSIPEKPGKKKRKFRFFNCGTTLKSGSTPSACTVGVEKVEESDNSVIFKNEEVVSNVGN